MHLIDSTEMFQSSTIISQYPLHCFSPSIQYRLFGIPFNSITFHSGRLFSHSLHHFFHILSPVLCLIRYNSITCSFRSFIKWNMKHRTHTHKKRNSVFDGETPVAAIFAHTSYKRIHSLWTFFCLVFFTALLFYAIHVHILNIRECFLFFVHSSGLYSFPHIVCVCVCISMCLYS